MYGNVYQGMSLVFLITILIIYTFLTPICDAKTKEYHRYKYLHGKFLISYVYTLRTTELCEIDRKTMDHESREKDRSGKTDCSSN